MTCNKCGGNLIPDQPCKLCDMFAAQRPPQANTDREFLMGNTNGAQFEGDPKAKKVPALGGRNMAEYIGDRYKTVAEKHGQNVKGKKYLRQLAKFPGDPEAWVDGKGDVQRVLEKRGWGVDWDGVGTNVQPRDPLTPPKEILLAENIIQERMVEMVNRDPGLKEKPREELREKIIAKHGRKKR